MYLDNVSCRLDVLLLPAPTTMARADDRGGCIAEGAGRFHLRIHLPEPAPEQRSTVERIVRAMKPAQVTAENVCPGIPSEPTRSERS